MLKIFLFIVFTFLTGFSPTHLHAQDIMNEMSANSQRYDDLFTERIQVISNSRKIFILSNEAKRFTKGDFISLLIQNDLGARALVAKVDNDRVGIKILKIYSLSVWSKMTPSTEVQIIIGDDSYFKKEKPKEEDDLDSIKDEADLFKNDLDIDDFGDDSDDTRAMRTDNIISIDYGNFSGINADEEVVNHPQFSLGWAHQISDNIYLEGMIGYTKITDFPSKTGIQTVVTNASLRAKYNFKTPLYTFTMPYVGIELLNVNSPEAGQNVTGAAKDKELRLVEELAESKTNLIFGVTVLRRLVPAWFMKLDLHFNSKGKFHYGIGFAIEF